MKDVVELFHELRNAQELDLLKGVVFDDLEISLKIYLYQNGFKTNLRTRATLGDYIQKNFPVNRVVWERDSSELTILLPPHIQSLLPKPAKILLSPDLYKLA